MKFYKSRTFKIFVGVLVVLIIGVAAAAAMHSGSSPANSVISTVFSPLQRASSFLAQKFSAFSINFKSSATLSKQVDELNKEIEDLQSQLVDYEQMKSQNALYKEFLELKESHKDYKFCEASVVGRDAANPLSAFVLNRGSNDGIAVNDPVIYGKYLVGVVTSVTLTQCTIKLYSTRASTPAHMRSARATSALSQRLRHTPRADSAPCPVFRAQRRSPPAESSAHRESAASIRAISL